MPSLQPFKVVFFGTPQFSADILKYLLDQGVNIVAAVSRPDKPKGRSLQLTSTPVKLIADGVIPVFQPESTSDPEFLEKIRVFNADLFILVAYGEIVKKELLEMPKKAIINVHPSLLPKYRGAAPIQRPIINGDQETGVTIMYVVKKMDAGDMIKQVRIPIGPDENFGQLNERLCEISKNLLLEVINEFQREIPNSTPQNESEVTYAPKVELEECEVKWSDDAQSIHNLIRGVNPFPGAWCTVNVKGERKRLKLKKSRVYDLKPEKGFIVKCGKGYLEILELQLEGKKEMKPEELLRGTPIEL